MAGWDQSIGGIVTHNGELVTHNDEPVTYDDGSGWNLLQGVVKTASTGTWDQAASWDALGSLEQIGQAGWEQVPATWESTGLSADDVTAEATFDQSGSWDAIAALSFPSEAAFTQANEWAAEGSHTEAEPTDVSATATWEQSATWAATATHPVTQLSGFDSRRPVKIRLSEIPHLSATASFGQGPAAWGADMVVDRSPVDIEELMLVGVL